MLVFAVNNGTMLLPVGNMFKDSGEETDNIHEAVAITAQLPDGKWLSIDDFDPLDLQRLS